MKTLAFARRLVAVLAGSMAVATSSVYAWHEQGHKDVGAIADRLLRNHRNAAAQVQAILGGVTLEQAGPWGDCVRPNSGPPRYVYNGNPRTESVCYGFAHSDALRLQMQDYVGNNWSTCPEPRNAGCHTQYHFADVAIQQPGYRDGSQVGTHPYDIVHAINAAIYVLRTPYCSGRNPPAVPIPGPNPFRFTCAHALMMLTHLVGDLHQPLHVGGVYLDRNGNIVDPDSPAERGRIQDTETRGGNLLHFSPDPHSEELHGHWDETPPQHYTDAELRAVGITRAPLKDLVALWADDSLALARRALAPLRFSPKVGEIWVVRFADRNNYDQRMAATQHIQIAKAGVHLAQLLVTIWPDR